jgi:hypothetical protein
VKPGLQKHLGPASVSMQSWEQEVAGHPLVAQKKPKARDLVQEWIPIDSFSDLGKTLRVKFRQKQKKG